MILEVKIINLKSLILILKSKCRRVTSYDAHIPQRELPHSRKEFEENRNKDSENSETQSMYSLVDRECSAQRERR